VIAAVAHHSHRVLLADSPTTRGAGARDAAAGSQVEVARRGSRTGQDEGEGRIAIAIAVPRSHLLKSFSHCLGQGDAARRDGGAASARCQSDGVTGDWTSEKAEAGRRSGQCGSGMYRFIVL